MSGLAAIFDFDGCEVEPGAIERMAAEMHYRGPDGISYERQKYAAMAFCALHTTAESVATKQPIKSDDGSLVLIFDGHLHNLAELKEQLAAKGAILRIGSDAEVALRAFEVWREGAPLRLDGEFAFVIWDSVRRQAFLARDHAGLKPLHYYWDGRRLIVASDQGAVLAAAGIDPELDEAMVVQILANEWINRGRTIWKDIKRLKPATWGRADRDGLRVQTYWSPPLEVSIRYSRDEEYVEHYLQVFSESVRQSSRSHLPIGTDVSGGLDSSAIFAMALDLKRTGRLLTTDIFGYTFKTEPGSSMYELDYVRAVAAHVGAPVREIEQFTPPLDWFVRRARADRDTAPYPNAALAIAIGEALVGDGCRVSLNGDGGDEWLSGRPYYYAEQMAEMDVRALVRTLREDGADIGVKSTAYRFARYGVLQFLPQSTRDVIRRLLMPQGPNLHDRAYWLQDDKEELRAECRRTADRSRLLAISNPARRMLMTTLKEPFGELMRDQLDRQSARSGHERRTPLYSRKFIEFAFAIPERQRLKGSRMKSIHVAAMAGLLPQKVLDRRDKAEFSPAFARYLDRMGELLEGPISAGSSGFLSASGMKRLYDEYRRLKDERPIWELWGAFACFAPLLFNGEAQIVDLDE